jgi:uncharacterized membrane protein
MSQIPPDDSQPAGGKLRGEVPEPEGAQPGSGIPASGPRVPGETGAASPTGGPSTVGAAGPSVPPAEAPPPPQPDPNNPDFVWTFRGYKMRASEFNTAMVHFFRAEVQRANVWRQRLDTTTNWAVVTTGAAISLAFSSPGNQAVILINLMLVTVFLMIEARRYRYYELWAYRVRLMETDFFAAMLVPPFHPSPDWAETLSENLLHPHFPISNLEAVGRRLRRNYLYIYGIVLVAWMARLFLIPVPAQNLVTLLRRAAIGPLSGPLVMGLVAAYMTLIVIIAIYSLQLHAAAGEVLPRFLIADETKAKRRSAWFRPSRRRPQLLTLVVTDHKDVVSEQILKDMRRGVTALPGTGMYTGKKHDILMVALTVTEVPKLKSIVADADAEAFVVVIPAQEVFGFGFMPLENEES